MKDKTKKWLVTAGLALVCIGLVFGISRVLYREPVQETLIGEKDTDDTEITVDIGKAETVQMEKTEAGEAGTDTEENLVIEIDTDTGAPDSGREQEIQPEPEKTEKEKPSGPPASAEDTDTGKTDTRPAGETPKEQVTQPPAEDQTPKTGDTKDGMVYVEGFGWLPDEGEGSGTYAGDMYENGNKIGIMD